MFERRLKILLTLVFIITGALFMRAFQFQVIQKTQWEKQADKMRERHKIIPTSRGPIVDRKGVLLAYDDACIDAAVDYRAIALDPEWIKKQASARLPPRSAHLPAGVKREQLLAEEQERVKADINRMWGTIGEVCKKTPEEIEQVKQDIKARVSYIQRDAWFKWYRKTSSEPGDQADSSWRTWLTGGSEDDGDDAKHEAAIDAARVEVEEQSQSHVIVEDLTDDQRFALEKVIGQCPGLELKQSTHRRYSPEAATIAAHVLGHMSPVNVDDENPLTNNGDELHKYIPRDVIGREGLEHLAEPVLRGVRGLEVYERGNRDPVESTPPIPGKEARTTIDIKLQQAIDKAFDTPITSTELDGTQQVFKNLHGAAVVIDVKSGEVLAMVSHPTFDLNQFDAEYRNNLRDETNKPLLNRATLLALPPGSTAKTVIGSVAVTRGVLSPDEGIECDGYLKVPDPRDPSRTIKYSKIFRCWTMKTNPKAPHHCYPFPQQSAYGLGFLTLSDGIERSCNVYFETVAARMKMPGVIDALDTFGLGRPTGIGIAEARGTVPVPRLIRPEQMAGETYTAGIGQGQVTATPLQMANVVATLARGGIWMRPKLLCGEAQETAEAHRRPSTQAFAEDWRDLHLAPAGLNAIREGMIRVCRSPSGTGPNDSESPGIRHFFDTIDMAGKTGSAQIAATQLEVNIRDENGELVREEGDPDLPIKQRKLKKQVYPIGSFPWLQGTGENHKFLAHAWFMGYAPAHDPKIAFCVLVEYGGSGGRVAGPIGRGLLQACVDQGYLQVVESAKPLASSQGIGSDTELLH